MMSGVQGESNRTLLVRRMPREFSDIDKKEFLEHFGAVAVRTVCLGGKKNEVVFATFSSPSATKAALTRLHQMEVLGCHLIVEYAHSSSSTCSDPGSSCAEKVENCLEEDKRQRLQDQFVRRLVSWSSKLNLSQPPPSHLRYQYPPPTPATLSNICRALSMYPRLYTQLLHLMNRMNLPPPFQDNYVKPACDQATQTDIAWIQKSSSESEMESEEETIPHPPDALPSKRIPRPRKIIPIKRPRFIKPAVPIEPSPSAVITVRPEEVFERTETEVHPKKIELRLSGSLRLDKEENDGVINALEAADAGGFGVMRPCAQLISSSTSEVDETRNVEDDGSVISSEQLASNRISQKDLQVLPVFKNYSPGVPSCRLYVKNVSKHAVARDLHYIYRYFLNSSPGEMEENDSNMFDVRLMTEGRMKGQAFITFPNVKQAKQALSETNGYILKDKPLVVQFARSAPAPSVPAASTS